MASAAATSEATAAARPSTREGLRQRAEELAEARKRDMDALDRLLDRLQEPSLLPTTPPPATRAKRQTSRGTVPAQQQSSHSRRLEEAFPAYARASNPRPGNCSSGSGPPGFVTIEGVVQDRLRGAQTFGHLSEIAPALRTRSRTLVRASSVLAGDIAPPTPTRVETRRSIRVIHSAGPTTCTHAAWNEPGCSSASTTRRHTRHSGYGA